MKIRTAIKAGAILGNHNEKMIKVKTGIKAGAIIGNHNEKMI